MADGTHDIHQEYWRPLNSPRNKPSDAVKREATCHCGAEYLVGSRYCHVCGSSREPNMGLKAHRESVVDWLDLDRIRNLTGLSAVPLTFFVIGALCALAAISIGWLRETETAWEFQVVQLWRIEMLLAAAVAFLVSIALKRN